MCIFYHSHAHITHKHTSTHHPHPHITHTSHTSHTHFLHPLHSVSLHKVSLAEELLVGELHQSGGSTPSSSPDTHKGKKKCTLEWSTLNFSLGMFFLHSSDIHFLQIALCSNLKYLSPLHCIAHTYRHSNNLYSNHWCACVLISVK